MRKKKELSGQIDRTDKNLREKKRELKDFEERKKSYEEAKVALAKEGNSHDINNEVVRMQRGLKESKTRLDFLKGQS